MTYIFQVYLPKHSVQELLIAGRWEEKDMDALTGIITWGKQRNIPVAIFGPVPEYDAPLPRLLAYSVAWKNPELASQHLVPGSALMDARMQELATSTWHVPYISLYQEICNTKGCVDYADPAHRIPLMSDTDHLTSLGASFVVQQLVEKGELN
jgi:hypothetical protein